jgi:hypothetical protein
VVIVLVEPGNAREFSVIGVKISSPPEGTLKGMTMKK